MKYLSFLLLTFSFVLFFSCLSSPDVEFEKATKYRARVQKYQLKEYAEAEYKTAEESFLNAKTAMDKKNNYKANKALATANQNYLKVLEKGLPPYTDKKDGTVQEEKKISDEIKANVAVKADYDDALKTYNEGVLLKNDKKYEEAIDKFMSAKDKFDNVYKVTREKKEKDEMSLDSTDKTLKAVQDKANELNSALNKQ